MDEQSRDKPERGYSPEEIAKAWSLNEATVRRWCRNGTLPAVKLGKQWRIPEGELRRVLRDE